MTTTDTRPRPQEGRRTRTPAVDTPRTGPADELPAEEVFALVCRLPMVAGLPSRRKTSRTWGVPVILAWLQRHPGQGWQEHQLRCN